jgi:hypothetical protein
MHTTEPWARNEQRIESSREHGVANDGWCIAEFYGPDAKENIRRTRACVNAMAGIESPAAFVAKVRELIAAARVLEGAELDMGLIRDDTGDIEELNAEATNVCEIARELAALLPAE